MATLSHHGQAPDNRANQLDPNPNPGSVVGPAPSIPESINWHLTAACNDACKFCFATFRDVRGRLTIDEGLRLLCELRGAGCSKINFVGGEPTLHPDIGAYIAEAKRLGLTVSLVTNGTKLVDLLERRSRDIDWVGLSIDSGDEETQRRLGRGSGDHVARSIELARIARARGPRIKLNTVVTAWTWREDMSDVVRSVRPDRWKVFQVLKVRGQNGGSVDDLLITPDQFRSFLQRHRHLEDEGYRPVAEDNEAMMGSYAMVDPQGRFFDNVSGQHLYSAPILEIGARSAFHQVRFDRRKFIARGGLYAWEV